MTFSPYGEAIYGETFYGVPPSSNNLTTSFTTTPIGYNGLQIDWTLPPGDWTSQVLVRSSFGTPTNIYAEDGVTLLDETSPANGYSSQFVDVGLASGYFYYYALFVFNTSGGLDQWQLAGSAQGLVISDYDFEQTYTGFIPDFYLNMDQDLATTAVPDGPLQRLLQLIGYETDWLRSEIESFFLFTNPQLISGALLPFLGANYGMSYEPELGMARYRVLVENAVALYKSRGTGNGIAAAASAFTGYGAVVTRGKNLEIQLDDSAFDRSIGHWVPQTNGTSMQTVSASSVGVSPPHAEYLPVPGDLSVDSAFGVNGYLPANNENVAFIESVGSIYWTQQPFSTTTPSARSAFTMTYYPAQSGVLLFAGLPLSTLSNYLDDTWLWNGTVWEQLFPVTSPPGRYGYAMAYHVPTETIFIYGGYSVESSEILDDMWAWNGATWTQVADASTPGPLFLPSMVYDPVSTDLVLFGGTNSSGTPNGVTYLWNGTAWSIGATAPNSPPAREATSMVYYPPASKVILFGGVINGSSKSFLGDMWEWNGSTSTWAEVVNTTFPTPRLGMNMVYDPNAAIIILFGGDGGYGLLDDTWIWDGTAWEEVFTTINPVARAYYGLEWFPENNVFLLFGGENKTQTFNDFWGGSYVDDPPISISTCTSENATTLGIPVAQVATPPSVVISASFTPVNQPNPVLRYIQMQIDWYTQTGAPISSSVGPPVQEVPGEWIRPYAVGSPPAGAYYYGRTVNMTSLSPPYVPPPIPNLPPPPYVPPVVGISPTIVVGTYVGLDDITDASSFITALGTNPHDGMLMDFLADSSWEACWNTTSSFTNFSSWLGPKLIKVPLQVTATPLLWTDVTGGSQDANFTAFFEWCYETGGVQHIALAWDFNQPSNTWPWGILSADTVANQTAFKAAWQHVWNLANAVAPGFFNFWWQPSAFTYVNFPDGEPGGAYWPGTAYVDTVGFTVYNTWNQSNTFPGDSAMLTAFESGNQPNWNNTLAFAVANELDIGISEWGMAATGSLLGSSPITVEFDVNSANTWTAPPGVSTVTVICGSTTTTNFAVTPGTTYNMTLGGSTSFSTLTGGAGNVTLTYTYNPGIVSGVSVGEWESVLSGMSPTALAAMCQSMKQNGCTYVRFDCDYVTGTVTNSIDNAIVAVKAAGMIPIIILEDTEEWNGGYGQGNFGSAYATFCGNAATHYLSVLGAGCVFELSNEVNQNYAWISGTVSPSIYAAVCVTATAAIKAVDPTTTVLSSGLAAGNAYVNNDAATTNSMSALDFMTGCYAHWAGKSPVDAHNVHPYTYSAFGDGDTNGGFPAEVSMEWNMFTQIPSIYSLMEANGDGAKKIWGTEFGLPVGTDQVQGYTMTAADQAAELAMAFQFWASYSYLGPFLVFNWFDSTDGIWGLYQSNSPYTTGTARPALQIFIQSTLTQSASANGGDDPTYVSNFWGVWVDAAIALAPNGNKIYVFPWENVGADPFSSFTNAMAQLVTSVGVSVSAGYVAPPSGAAAPVISSLNPTFGATAGGTSVEIIGSNFNDVVSVKFGTVNAASYVVNSPTQITAITPAEAAGAVSVTVVTGGGISNAISYTFGSSPGVPTVTGVAPTTGVDTGGTAVVITGTNLTGATAVKFGSTNASSFTVNSSTQITATAPSEADGTVDITVTTPGGTSATSGADQYTFTPPSGGLVPTGPTGSFTLVWHDEFDDTTGMSGPTHGLNYSKWNCGWFYQPATVGGTGNETTCDAEGNTGNYHGPSVLALPGDGTLHLKGVSPGPDQGGTLTLENPSTGVNVVRTYEAGAIHTGGLLLFNPANLPLTTAYQNAVNAGTVTCINGPCVLEMRMQMPGLVSGTNASNWWWGVWLVTQGDATASGGGYGSYLNEIDLWEWYDWPLPRFHNQIYTSSHQAVPTVNATLQANPAEMSTGFHVYTVELTATSTTIWSDGTLVFEDTSGGTSQEWEAAVMRLIISIQTQQTLSGANVINNPPNTTSGSNTDMQLDYVRVWKPA
jgi:hypothetical protein